MLGSRPTRQKLEGTPDSLGHLSDDLALAACEDGDHEAAARLQRQAVTYGLGARQADARAMLGWYLISAGALEESEAVFSALLADEPNDVNVRTTRGLALEEVDHAAALAAFDDAIAVARALDVDRDELHDPQNQREDLRRRMGLPFDRDDREALGYRALRQAPLEPPEEPFIFLWFPGAEAAKAAERWPHLGMYGVGEASYVQEFELTLRTRAAHDGLNPTILPMSVDEVIARDVAPRLQGPTDAEQDRLLAWVAEGTSVAWPPGRNDACWCRMGRKYKKCCGAL